MPRDVVLSPLVFAGRTLDALRARVGLLRDVGVLCPEVAVEGSLVEVAFAALGDRTAEGLAVFALVLPICASHVS